MQTTTLGRTGLSVSVAGLGCGGHSCLGMKYGASEAQSISIVQTAIDLGVNFIDTASNYGTEEIVGKAIAGQRDQVVISTKLPIVTPGTPVQDNQFLTVAQFIHDFEGCLARLGTDYVDILHLHGIMHDQYDYCANELVPALQRLQEQGLLRFLGLTERFVTDPQHAMLMRALEDDCWDVIMPGFNLINPSARDRIFPLTDEKNIAVLNMFAVRKALSQPEALRRLIAEMIEEDVIDPAKINPDDPLSFLIEESDAESIVEAAYRFCRHEPGTTVILTGTGKIDHLKENLNSIQRGPLPETCLNRLQDIFGAVDSVSGN